MATTRAKPKPLKLGDVDFMPGTWGIASLPVGHLITHELIHLQVHVLRGCTPGPRLFLSAAVHGDEINGVQIARELLGRIALPELRGDLLIIPVVNQPAFVARSRYLPDRRDLNRLFPGNSTGSFGARLARVFTNEVIQQCTHGIDLHTGAVNRPNLPQIRVSADSEDSIKMAKAFNAPAIIDSPTRDGSLRGEMFNREKPMILYEAGESQILDPLSVTVGVDGIMRVLHHLEMLTEDPSIEGGSKKTPTVIAKKSSWVRAPRGGIFIPQLEMGKAVNPDSILGTVGDPFGESSTDIIAGVEGIVIGRTKQAVVDEGDGLFHVAYSRDPEGAEEKINRNERELDERFDRPVFDDPE